MITVLLNSYFMFSLFIVIELFLQNKTTNLLAAHFVCFGLKNRTSGWWAGGLAADRGNEKKSLKSLATLFGKNNMKLPIFHV